MIFKLNDILKKMFIIILVLHLNTVLKMRAAQAKL